MTGQFERQLEAAQSGARRVLAPYERFVRAEQDHIATFARELASLRARAAQLPHEIGEAPRRQPIDSDGRLA